VVPLTIAFASFTVPFMLAEWLWPGTSAKRNYFAGAKIWFVSIVLIFCWEQTAGLFRTMLQSPPLIEWKVESGAGWLDLSFRILLSAFIYDFFDYWFHRAQHSFAWLWRFHRVHHSIADVNCLNGYHHFAEDMIRFAVVVIPVGLLVGIELREIIFLSAFVTCLGQYVHSDTRLTFGRFNIVMADNVYHRIHHSCSPRHFNKNFAGHFPILDVLFGTYEKPVRGQLGPTGLSDLAPPKTVLEYVLMPLGKRGTADRVAAG
jgi:sterol desaturase/sphingolipid hydroxylase (fatty acid hydroxylase superfamily)